MSFLAEKIEEPVAHFLAEHEYARQRISNTGIKDNRFVDERTRSVIYLTAIRPALMDMDEIEGLLFFSSNPIAFSASRYGGHLATEIKLEKTSIPQAFHKHEQEIVNLINGGLRYYIEWYKIAFWEQ